MNQDIFIACAKKNWRTDRFARSTARSRGPARPRVAPASDFLRRAKAVLTRGRRMVEPLGAQSDAETHDDLVAIAHHVFFSLDVLQSGGLHFALRAEPHEVVNSHDFGPNKASR